MLQLYRAALLEWAEAVGPENVVTETASLRAAEKGTFATGHTIPAIVRPGDRHLEGGRCLNGGIRPQAG